jgi:hypothetical protein
VRIARTDASSTASVLEERRNSPGLLPALLHDRGPMGQGDLGAAVGTDPGVLVVLTDSGARKLRGAARAQQRAEDALFSALDQERRAQLRELLVAVRDSQPTGEPSPCKED